jgi:hypothetical protein
MELSGNNSLEQKIEWIIDLVSHSLLSPSILFATTFAVSCQINNPYLIILDVLFLKKVVYSFWARQRSLDGSYRTEGWIYIDMYSALHR